MRTTSSRFYMTVLLLAVAIAGCVSHSPVSELLIFHDVATTPSSENSSGFGMAVSMQPLNPARNISEAIHEGTGKNYADNPYNSYRLSAGFYAARFDEKGDFAIATTFGAMVAGIDATAKLWRRNYLSVGVSAPRQMHLGLMHRTYNSTRLGAAVGLAYKREVYAFPTGCYCYGADESINTAGGRAFLVYRPDRNGGSGMKVGLYAGYAPQLSRPLFTLTLVTGRF